MILFMKIEKIKMRTDATITDVELAKKLNEVIDLLNNSFLTKEYDEAILDVTDPVTNISCGRVTHSPNETTYTCCECGHSQEQ